MPLICLVVLYHHSWALSRGRGFARLLLRTRAAADQTCEAVRVDRIDWRLKSTTAIDADTSPSPLAIHNTTIWTRNVSGHTSTSHFRGRLFHILRPQWMIRPESTAMLTRFIYFFHPSMWKHRRQGELPLRPENSSVANFFGDDQLIPSIRMPSEASDYMTVP